MSAGWISSAGAFVRRFEDEFAAAVGCQHGVACSSGTAALHLALGAAGVGPGDEVVIPTFTMGAWYTVAAGDNGALWELSSDHMAPGQPKGHTFHADFFMAWDPSVHDMWWQNCINKLLNCSGGQLGNGKELKGAATHNLMRTYKYSQRLVPKP